MRKKLRAYGPANRVTEEVREEVGYVEKRDNSPLIIISSRVNQEIVDEHSVNVVGTAVTKAVSSLIGANVAKKEMKKGERKKKVNHRLIIYLPIRGKY